jgi:hypothetical protein
MHLTRFLAPVLAAGLLAVAVDANAGSLVVRDEAQVFTPGDTEQLRAIVAKAPFDARLVTTTSYADQPGFSRFVGTLVSEPNMVVLGIDPTHHHVQVHFGTGSHIPQASWPAIERAGNDAFKRAAWEEGGADIFRAAATAVSTGGGAAAPVTSPAGDSGGSLLGMGLIVMLVIGVIFVAIVAAVLFAIFRRRSPGYGSVGYGGGAPYPGGGGPYYGPGGTRGAMGPLGGGLIGAGLGGVAGYELGKMEGEREQRGYDQGGFGAGGGGSSTSGNGSFDAGGGGSSWDDSGSSGGGGSDFGGGGGGDSGGGGSDF